ncbi:hypothetical protein TRICI_002100 [Trichomonascus ciferrii]|uniref:J domain-containing protein n=1 Tax=Trichomonascus ciferrii TaxID=44093 RepID=A0A6A1LVA0_9ASCO|nr:hypothetical protein TRICI_002100 [Trichomonascus ciferrii]
MRTILPISPITSVKPILCCGRRVAVLHFGSDKRSYHAQDPPVWPRKGNPTPYEIFGLNKHSFNKRDLKAAYVKLAKIYHPDSNGVSVASQVSQEVRLDRFKKIVAAYNTLRDDEKRRAYDLSAHRAQTYRPRHHNRYHDMAYDFYDEGQFQQRSQQRSAEFDAKLNENRKKLTVLVALATILCAIIQIKTINKVSEKYIDEQREYTFRTQLDELNAKTNYGMGSLQDQRIARFLTTRQTGGYYNPYQGDPHAPVAALPPPNSSPSQSQL